MRRLGNDPASKLFTFTDGSVAALNKVMNPLLCAPFITRNRFLAEDEVEAAPERSKGAHRDECREAQKTAENAEEGRLQKPLLI